MASSSTAANHALVVCDCQPDALNALDSSIRLSLLNNIRIAVTVAQRSGWTIRFSGLRFASGYPSVSASHKLYGALRRLNEKVGDGQAHWFMEGYEGAAIHPQVIPNDDTNVVTIWRSSHLPSNELLSELQSRSITNVTVVGIKAGYAVQATVQALCDQGMNVTVVEECIQDDDKLRLKAVLQHIVPIFANIISLADLVDETVGLESYQQIAAAAAAASDNDDHQNVFDLADCGRGGHMALYASHLLQRSGWRRYPLQKWYTDNFTGRQYHCPLGHKIVNFCDEPQFSRVAMYLKGREWLDEKEKVMELAKSIMPTTFVLDCGNWVEAPSSEHNSDHCGPWFIKECDKNGGRSIQICHLLQECHDLADPKSSYVVQAHIDHPLLTDQGHKCHVKFYSLLQCHADGVSWELHSYQDAFLCTSPNPWTQQDISKETQVTVKRHKRMRAGEEIGDWQGWPDAYQKCKDAVTMVVKEAIEQGKLLGRAEKKQFEIFSADFMLDTFGKAWLIEFNFGPVLFDPFACQVLATEGLKEYQRLYDLMGNRAEVNDHTMIREAISIIFFPDEVKTTRWDPAGEFKGQASKPTDTVAPLKGIFASMIKM